MEIHVDKQIPAVMKAEQYMNQVRNPYYFRCGDITVNVCFSADGRTLKDAMKAYLQMCKESDLAGKKA